MGSKHFRSGAALLTSLVCALVAQGCAGLRTRVDRLASQEKYSDALRLLESAGVGVTVKPTASQADRDARAAYGATVDRTYTGKIRRAVAQGRAREALQRAVEGLNLCPWSETLQSAVSDRQRAVDTIEELQRRWSSCPSANDIEELRALLSAVSLVRDQLADSPEATSLVQEACASVVDFWVTQLPERVRRAEGPDFGVMGEDLKSAGAPPGSVEEVCNAARLLGGLPWTPERGIGQSLLIGAQQLIELRHLVGRLRILASNDAVSRVNAAIARTIGNWSQGPLLSILRQPQPSMELIGCAESMLESLPDTSTDAYRAALAGAHMQRAAVHATEGKVAALSLLHLARARALGAGVHEDASGLEYSARAAFGVGASLGPTIAIDVAPEVDPQLNLLLQFALISAFAGRTQTHWRWKWTDPIYGKPQICLRIDSCRLEVPSLADLQVISSTYLSHYETVPNPAKEYLATLLSSAKWQVSFAESSYNSAVSSHITPATKH
jgi:hypothetical protein